MDIERGEVIRINIDQRSSAGSRIKFGSTDDLKTRWWKTIGEVLPQAFVDEVVGNLNLIIFSQ